MKGLLEKLKDVDRLDEAGAFDPIYSEAKRIVQTLNNSLVTVKKFKRSKVAKANMKDIDSLLGKLEAAREEAIRFAAGMGVQAGR
jgi:hypothetical protein